MAFELTALPPPDVIQKVDYEDILTRVVSRLRAINPDYTNIVEGDPAYSTIQATCYEVAMILQRINDAARAVLAPYAIGADLDNLAVSLNVYRKILQMGDPTADPPVPEELENDTSLRKRYLNKLETIAPGSEGWYENYASEAPPVKAVQLNLEVTSYLSFVDEATFYANPDGTTWSLGTTNGQSYIYFKDLITSDITELEGLAPGAEIIIEDGLIIKDTVITDLDDVKVFEHIQAHDSHRMPITGFDASGLTNTSNYDLTTLSGTKLESVKDSVVRKKRNALDQVVPGSVTVWVEADTDDAVPNNSLLKSVGEYLTVDERRFICDTVEVSAIQVESYALTAAIKPVTGLDPNTVLADIQKRAEEFATERKLIGQEIPLSHIYAVLTTDAVREVTISSPTANVVPTATEVPVASAVTISLAP